MLYKKQAVLPFSSFLCFQWKIGDTCTARFSEDGQMYDAVILSINKPDQTCLVQYVDYGNEETQALSALLQVASLHGKSNCRLPNDSHVASDVRITF